MTYETLKSIFENSYPGKKEIFEKLVSPIFNKARDLTSSDRDFSTEVDSSKIKSCTIFAQVGGAFPITFADVELKENVSVKTNRVAIQNCVRRILDNNTNAIIFFHQPESTEWRVSYVHRGSSNKDSTNAKRYTYLCGKNYACRTVSERFLELTNITRINDEVMLKAFSVATLSDEFFDEYKVFYEDFVQFITGNRYLKKGGKNKWEKIKIHEPNKDIFPQFIKIAQKELNSTDEEIIIPLAQKLVRDYIKKLMGRLVFLQFLQKRGWLGVPKNENWGEGDKNYIQNLFSNSEYKDDFLDKVLETLFFDTLNTKRDNDICESILGNEIKIPYLNGGLFEKDMIFDSTNIKFPKEFFSNPEKKEVERKFAGEIEDYPYIEYSGILDFFGKFNFTIDETDPYDQEIGVDPEMLGKIFENLLEDNKDKGAFYTPKEIVQYMCRESLIAYLLTDSQIEGDKIRDFVINHTDNFLDEEKTEIKEKLENVKICDPAVGSGAFPMGMLNELYACRHIIENDLQPAKIKGEIVKNNIYGVDIEKGAVDIARLRFWLAIIVDEDEPKPLPNLDYKIMQGNSLLECYEGIDLSNLLKKEELSGKGTDLFGKYIDPEDAVKELKNAKIDSFDYEINRYFDIDNHDEKKKSQETILEIVKNQIVDLLELKIKKERIESKSLESAIQTLCDKIKFLSKTPNDPEYKKTKKDLDKQESKYKKLLEVISYIENKQEEIEKLSHENSQFFLWHTWFYDVFNRPNDCNGGFDIVIGNPPYISAPMQIANTGLAEQRQKLVESKNYKSLYQKWDLYIPFIELGTKLSSENGITTMIVPFPLTNQLYAKTLRKMLIEENNMFELVDLNGTKIFDNATVSNCIPFVRKGGKTIKTWISNIFENKKIQRVFEQNISDLIHDEKALVWNVTQEKRETNRHSNMHVLGDFCYISKGMVLNSDEKETKDKFVKAELISETQDKIHCRKFLEGKDCGKYIVNKIRYLEYNTERVPRKLSRPTFRELYTIPKLMFNRLGELQVFFDEDGNFTTSDAMFVCLTWKSLSDVENKSISSSIKKFSTLSREEMETLSETVDLKYLLAIMNSRYASVLLTNLRGGDYHIYPEHIRNIPIPSVIKEQQQLIIDLVDKILATKKGNPQADTSALEHQIDLLVYHLYGLTYEEAQIIDNNLTEEEFNTTLV